MSSVSCTQLETNLDDITPEILGSVIGKLMREGALDAWILPAVMKKNRPGHQLCVLVENEDAERFKEMLFAETGTFGIRVRPVERAVLERSVETCETEFGKIRFKTGRYHGKVLVRKPEFEDCKAAAERLGIPLLELMRRLK